MRKAAIVIGIDNYLNAPPLRAACHDAVEVAAALQMPEYGFATTLLLDHNATQAGAQAVLSTIFANPADITLIYMSGHGFTHDQRTYFATVDSDSSLMGIDLLLLKHQIVASPASVVLILDCCHAGAADIKALSLLKPISTADLDRILGGLPRGKFLIAACLPTASAYESPINNHGEFTFHLLQGLMGAAANNQGFVTPLGLFDHVASAFEAEERQRQTPVFKGESAGLVVLGAGFLANAVVTSVDSPLSPDLILQTRSTASELLQNYHETTNVTLGQWRSEGYKRASQILPPIMRWFERQASEYPSLLADDEFVSMYSDAQSRLAQLGTVSVGMNTLEGIVERHLGSGAFGSVWKTRLGNDSFSAYKIFHPQDLFIKEKVARFRRGYQAMTQLDHPNIVKVLNYTASPVGFSMEFIDGPNLREFAGTLHEPRDIIGVLMVISETLAHSHSRNVVHRDVKPENIVMTYFESENRWVPYLTDFDLAWFSAATQVTKQAFGAIFYAAPEQLAKPTSSAAHAPTTDIWSFGQLMFFMATGSDPVPLGAANNALALRQRLADWGTVDAVEGLVDLYGACTRENPGSRINSFLDVTDRLYAIDEMLREIDPESPVDGSQFIKELVFLTTGAIRSNVVSERAFRSVSGRTVVTIADPQEEYQKTLTVGVRLAVENLALPGRNSAEARQVLHGRLQAAFRSNPQVQIIPGDFGPYEVSLNLFRIPSTRIGVEAVRQIISRAINSLER